MNVVVLKAVFPVLLSILLLSAIVEQSHLSPKTRLLCLMSDSTGISTPTGSASDYTEEEDADTASINNIKLHKMVSGKSQKIYDASGTSVTKMKPGKIYIQNRKKFVFAD